MTDNSSEIRLPFRPRARLLQLLGDHLIGTPRLAVFELVKNAYDADATSVTVTLEKLSSAEARIVIEDDGDGMTLQTIQDIWLVPAHDHRQVQRTEQKRTRHNRLPLGEKGLGRFAVHKLGDRIELVTRAQNSSECVVLIDWDNLIDKPFLSDAEVAVHVRHPTVFHGNRTGTRITVSRLRGTVWSRGEVRRLHRQITSISSPFSERSDKFDVELRVSDHPEWIATLPDTTAILQRAPWHFRFSFDNGKLSWTYKFRGVSGIKLAPRTISRMDEPLLLLPDRDADSTLGSQKVEGGKRPRRVVAGLEQSEGIGPVSGELYIYDREREILTKIGESRLVEDFLDENGGVRVYRDGIRVYNYGEPGEDWLGLDLRRVNAPTRNISRNIVVGAIDISLQYSAALTEKTSREGFVENDAYRRFRQTVIATLSLLETERKIDKDNIRALTGKARDPEVERISKPLERLREVARKHELSAKLDPLIDKVERDYNEMRDAMLRAGISGMSLAVVFHEIEQGVRVLHDAIVGGIKPESIVAQSRELVKILDGFTELLRKGERKQNSLKHLIQRARDINRVRFRTHAVRLECPTLEHDVGDLNANFAFGLALGALNNLLDNAFYWLQVRWPEQATVSKRSIYIGLTTELPEGPAIIVADNGPGFQDDPERLIRPFFSRRPDGMGVGLYYSNMVMELNGGRLAFPESADVGVPTAFDGAVVALIFGSGGNS